MTTLTNTPVERRAEGRHKANEERPKALCRIPGCQRVPKLTGRGYCHKHVAILNIHKPKVPAAQAHQRLQEITGRGFTLTEISTITGISRSTLSHLNNWDGKGLRGDTYEMLDKMDTVGEPCRAVWPIRRRVQALLAAGVKTREISEDSGISIDIIQRLAFREKLSIDPATSEAIKFTYEKLSARAVRPVSTSIKYQAWPLPMEWVDIDDPEESHEPERNRIRLTAKRPTRLVQSRIRDLVEYHGDYKTVGEIVGMSHQLLARIEKGTSRIEEIEKRWIRNAWRQIPTPATVKE